MVYDVIIIGAGQAGLSMGYFLKKSHLSFLILDKANVVGDVWRSRYDSLTLFTTRKYSSLPGLLLDGYQDGFPSRDEIADYLKRYADTFSLPIKHNMEVPNMLNNQGIFEIYTNCLQQYKAKKVVVATGPFQTPIIPSISRELDKSIIQLHSSEYQNITQLQDGAVLVVGGGNSGTQIAVELSEHKEVYLSVGQNLKFLPLKLFSKSIFWWFDKFGILNAKKDSIIGRKLQSQGDPIFGYELKGKIKEGNVSLKQRTTKIKDNIVFFEDNSSVIVKNIIWATGFNFYYEWIDIPDLLDIKGNPIHERGITNINGLYFLGLPWQHKRGSSLLLGVGEDAQYLFQHILKDSELLDSTVME